MHRVLATLLGIALVADVADALVGGAPRIEDEFARSVVAVVGQPHSIVTVVGLRSTFCTATAITPTLLLTAAHCVPPGNKYKLQYRDKNGLRNFTDIDNAERHPQFDPAVMRASGASADLALLRLAHPLPPEITVAQLGLTPSEIWPGDRLIVVGAGVTMQGNNRSVGTNRVATLAAVGLPDNLQIRLSDPSADRRRIGLGACNGDSGSPVFQAQVDNMKVIGVVSWATGLGRTPGCGNLTGATRLAPYSKWIEDTARNLGVSLDN